MRLVCVCASERIATATPVDIAPRPSARITKATRISSSAKPRSPRRLPDTRYRIAGRLHRFNCGSPVSQFTAMRADRPSSVSAISPPDDWPSGKKRIPPLSRGTLGLGNRHRDRHSLRKRMHGARQAELQPFSVSMRNTVSVLLAIACARANCSVAATARAVTATLAAAAFGLALTARQQEQVP